MIEHDGPKTRYLATVDGKTTTDRDRALLFLLRPEADAAAAKLAKEVVVCTAADVAQLVTRQGRTFWHRVATFNRTGAA